MLVVSAHELEILLAKDKNHLVDTFLHKPVNASTLFNAVNDSIVKHTGNSARVLESTQIESIKAKWLPDISVLVVDDSELNLEVVETILTRNGAKVTTANSGLKALEHLKNTPDQFDVVLMDVQMPVMDGLEAVTRIRRDLKLIELPVIALTAGVMQEERKRAFAAGMDHFLTKPIEPTRLIQSIRILVEGYRKKSIIISSLETDEDFFPYSDWPTIKGLKNTSELLQGNLILFVSSIKNLLDEYSDLETMASGEIANLDDQQKQQEIASRLHKLRSTAGIVGAQQLYDFASKAEIDLRSQKGGVESLLMSVGQALAELRVDSREFLQGWSVQQANENKIDLSNVEVIAESDLTALIVALENNDMSASKMIKSLSLQIKALIGTDKFEQFNQLIQSMNYKQAAELLKQN